MHQVRAKLWLSGLHEAQNLQTLISCNISHVLSLIEGELSSKFPGIKYHNAWVFDDERADILSRFSECCVFIEHGLQVGTGVLVHCRSGRSSNAAVVCAFLMWRENLSAAEALTNVKKVHFCNLNAGFVLPSENTHWKRRVFPPSLL